MTFRICEQNNHLILNNDSTSCGTPHRGGEIFLFHLLIDKFVIKYHFGRVLKGKNNGRIEKLRIYFDRIDPRYMI